MLIGDTNNRVADIVGTNREATLNSKGRKLIDFCTINNLKIMNTFFKHKENRKVDGLIPDGVIGIFH